MMNYVRAVSTAAENVAKGRKTTISHPLLPWAITVEADGTVRMGFFALPKFKITDFLGNDWRAE